MYLHFSTTPNGLQAPRPTGTRMRTPLADPHFFLSCLVWTLCVIAGSDFAKLVVVFALRYYTALQNFSFAGPSRFTSPFIDRVVTYLCVIRPAIWLVLERRPSMSFVTSLLTSTSARDNIWCQETRKREASPPRIPQNRSMTNVGQ